MLTSKKSQDDQDGPANNDSDSFYDIDGDTPTISFNYVHTA